MTVQETYPAGLQQERLNDIKFVLDNPEYTTAQSVCDEVADLVLQGHDVALVDPVDEDRPNAEQQKQVDEMAEFLEQAENGAELFVGPPAMQKWAPLTKRAIALHPLYSASTARNLGDGIGKEAYDIPLFPVKDDGVTRKISAKEMLFREKDPAKANKILNSYLDFVDTPIDETSRLFYMGSKDAAGVRTRAITAMGLAREHFAEDSSTPIRQDLVSASLACGAAGPVYDLVKSIREAGGDFAKAILVDKDEMALASAAALAGEAGVKGIVDIQRRDLLTEQLTDYIEPNSVDIIDLLGLFEYLPTELGILLLQQVKAIARPGGLIVFGNMLNDRSQQILFTDVAKWPPLEQRGISEVHQIIKSAGFSLDQVTTRVPSREGVYGVYGIRIPKATNSGRPELEKLIAA